MYGVQHKFQTYLITFQCIFVVYKIVFAKFSLVFEFFMMSNSDRSKSEPQLSGCVGITRRF